MLLGKYKVIREIKAGTVYHVSDRASNEFIVKYVSGEDHPLTRSANMDPKQAAQRSVKMTELFSNLGLGPRLVGVNWSQRGVLLTTEFIPLSLTSQVVKKKNIASAIEEKIQWMHDQGIVHGDLHANNIRLGNAGSVYFIDPDTAFTIEEYKTEQFPRAWIQYGFDIEDLQEFLEHEREDFYSSVDE
jgi:tRNA A-37 threonylcarbamoyl transferase component Bud32